MSKIFYLDSVIEKSVVDKKKKGLRIAGYANTIDRDRGGDIIEAAAWAKGVDNYRKNPVLLYQHDKNKAIGRVEKIRVDRKGIYVEAYVSDAAEKLHGVQTLIKDGALKSFSVGFIAKQGKDQPKGDGMIITDVELLEISIVSIPANQESLFSVRKSFATEEEFNAFKKTITQAELLEHNNKMMAGITTTEDGHYHTLEVDNTGNGNTTYGSHGVDHVHDVVDNVIQEADGHKHDVKVWTGCDDVVDEATEEYSSEESLLVVDVDLNEKEEEATTSEDEEEILADTDPYKPIPFVNLLNAECNNLTKGMIVKFTKSIVCDDKERFKIIGTPTDKEPIFTFKPVDINGNEEEYDAVVTAHVSNLAIVNKWDIGTQFDLQLTGLNKELELTERLRNEIRNEFNKLVTMNEQELFSLKGNDFVTNNATNQQTLNKLLNLVSLPIEDWTDTNYTVAKHICTMIKALKDYPSDEAVNSQRNIALMLHGYKTINEEKTDMTTQSVGEPIKIGAAASSETPAPVETKETSVEVNPVSREEQLVQKTGEAILAQAAEQETAVEAGKEPKIGDNDEVAALKAQLKAVSEQLTSITTNKMVYTEQARNTKQFSDRDIANAYLLSKALGKHVYETRLGARMKAVTSVDQFTSTFSSDIYEEMQQQLIIAPMLRRVQVSSKTFRVPVADEETDGDVAQFASGTYATGIADTSRVPTTNQHTISAVEFTPHKWMATTHLAKDEQEDTILPLMDFLRQATTRRIARAIDKSLLRGDGSLSGFTASPTNAISVGSGYASVLKGLCKLADDATLRVGAGSNTKASATNIAQARALMGKYGLQLGDHLIYLTTIEGYNELVQTSDFRTVDKFGPNATYLTGSIGAIYGIPVFITEFLDNAGASNNHIGLLVYKPGFLIAERRAMEIETQYEPRQQVTAIYLSTRLDMKALTTVAAAALSSQYSMAALVRSA